MAGAARAAILPCRPPRPAHRVLYNLLSSAIDRFIVSAVPEGPIMRAWMNRLSGIVILVGLPASAGAGTDLRAMPAPEIVALQHRLADAGCYSGAPDGQASPATAAAVQACPDQNPMLRIETGTHVATIKRISVDAECRLMATASEDKTVRLWAIPEGRLLQTIRFPIDDVNGGKLNAVALSSNGRMLAAGGWDAGWEKGKAMGGLCGRPRHGPGPAAGRVPVGDQPSRLFTGRSPARGRPERAAGCPCARSCDGDAN